MAEHENTTTPTARRSAANPDAELIALVAEWVERDRAYFSLGEHTDKQTEVHSDAQMRLEERIARFVPQTIAGVAAQLKVAWDWFQGLGELSGANEDSDAGNWALWHSLKAADALALAAVPNGQDVELVRLWGEFVAANKRLHDAPDGSTDADHEPFCQAMDAARDGMLAIEPEGFAGIEVKLCLFLAYDKPTYAPDEQLLWSLINRCKTLAASTA